MIRLTHEFQSIFKTNINVILKVFIFNIKMHKKKESEILKIKTIKFKFRE